MTKDRGPWPDGRRAWERLRRWYRDAPSSHPGGPSDGSDDPDGADAALGALADVGLVRRLLDQAELVAVRTARRQGRSWTEIAVRLGITRQSAWERWRDLDDAGPAAEVSTARVAAIEAAAAEAAERAGFSPGSDDVPFALLARAARVQRRRSSVRVPDVVGRRWDDARRALHDVGLVGVGPDPDGPPLAAEGWPDAVVTDQSPESGAKVPAGSPVTLWLERGGGSGVREPRHPKPNPLRGRAMRPEPSDEAVS